MDINRNPGGYFWPSEHRQPRAKPWLFLGYRSAVLRKNSLVFSIAICYLRRHLYYEHSYLPASLLLTPERGSPSHRQFLKTNSFHEVLRLRNSFLRNSTFVVRYSIFLQSCEPMDINRNPGGYFWPSEHRQPRAKPWLFLGYRSAVLRKNSPAFSIAICHLRRHLYYEHRCLPASLLLTPERGSPSHRQFLKTNSFHEVLRLRNSFLRNSTFVVRYSIFLQSCEPMDINRNPGGYFWPYEHLQPRAKPWLFLGYRSAVLRVDWPCIFYRTLPATEASLLRTSLPPRLATPDP